MEPTDDPIEAQLAAAEDAFAAGDLARVDALLRELPPQHARVLLLDGLLRWERRGPEAAVGTLQAAVEAAPEDGDAAHSLATALEDLGRLDEAIAFYLRVRSIDEAREREGAAATREELDLIERVAAEVLAGLPPPFREAIRGVPVLLDGLPSLHLVEEGFDPRALGLFEGPQASDEAISGELPAHIVLFTTNLVASFPDLDQLAEQVEITVLHEVGHYFGLEEHDMHRLGLE